MIKIINPLKILFIILMIINTTNTINAQSLTLAIAANFRDPMTEITNLFKTENPAVEVRTIFGSSGNLYQQISQHAPFDIFFSANMSFPQKAFDNGLCYEPPQAYSIGQLVLWSKSIDVTSGINILIDKQITKISVANPTLAPYGESAIECLKYFNIYKTVKNKIVIADNISQTAQFAATGNVDVGILAMSQLHSKSIRGMGSYSIIPAKSYTPIKQGFVIVKRNGNEMIARKFISFMNSERIKQIIIDYGYSIDE